MIDRRELHNRNIKRFDNVFQSLTGRTHAEGGWLFRVNHVAVTDNDGVTIITAIVHITNTFDGSTTIKQLAGPLPNLPPSEMVETMWDRYRKLFEEYASER